MKTDLHRIKGVIVFLSLCLLALIFHNVSFSAASEQIELFQSEYKINSDATVDVIEKIQYSFGSNERHGIFRLIPYRYETNNSTRIIKIEELKVQDENAKSIKFQTQKEGNNLKIKIGDPNVTISGTKEYNISYKINGAINYFDGYDEFYWNVTGNDWKIPINEVEPTIYYPSGTTKENARIKCFVGAYRQSELCDDALIKIVSGQTMGTLSQKNLNSGEGTTLVAGFPKDLVAFQKPTEEDNDIFGLVAPPWIFWLIISSIFIPPAATFGIMFNLWYKGGRDPKGRGTIIAQYEPPRGLSPIQVGALVSDKIKNKLASAEVMFLAQQGYLKITKLNKKILVFNSEDYELKKLKVFDNKLPSFDVVFFNALFGERDTVKVSELKGSSTKNLIKKFNDQKKEVFRSLTDLQYYNRSPFDVRKKYSGITAGFAIVGITLLSINPMLIPFGIGFFASAIISTIFTFIMPAKTVKGAIEKEYVLGFKEYLMVAEKDRLKFHNSPAAEPKTFERFLPYAVALGVEKEWAEKFKDLYKTQPDWYSDSSGAAFNAAVFASSMNNFSSNFNGAVFTSAAASGSSGFSSGGGFSGGGFGGGGGGSW